MIFIKLVSNIDKKNYYCNIFLLKSSQNVKEININMLYYDGISVSEAVSGNKTCGAKQ